MRYYQANIGYQILIETDVGTLEPQEWINLTLIESKPKWISNDIEIKQDILVLYQPSFQIKFDVLTKK